MTTTRLLKKGIASLGIGLLLIIGYAAYSVFAMPHIPPHRGDGRFQDISKREGPFALRGYTVVFDGLDLSKPQKACYQFSSLPDIGLECALYFAIQDPHDVIESRQERRFDRGHLTLRLSTSAGSVLREINGKLNEFIWARFGRGDHLMYQLNRSFFFPDVAERYTLEISYTPDPQLVGFTGHACIQCGGVK